MKIHKWQLYACCILLTLFASARATDLTLGFSGDQSSYSTIGGAGYAYRFYVDSAGTADSCLAFVSDANAIARGFYALYTDSSNGRPGHTLWVLQPDSFFVTATPAWKHGAINTAIGTSLTPGWYWIAVASNVGNGFRIYETTGTTAADSCAYGWFSFSGTFPSPLGALNGYTAAHPCPNLMIRYHTAGGGGGGGTGAGSLRSLLIKR